MFFLIGIPISLACLITKTLNFLSVLKKKQSNTNKYYINTCKKQPNPNTHAPVPQQPRRPHGLAALPGPGHGPPACATQTTRKRSLTPMASLCKRPRSRRSPGELHQFTVGAVICWGLPGGRERPEGGRDGATGSGMGSKDACLMDA